MLFDVYVFKCQLHSTWCGQNETALKITRNNSTKIEFVHCPLREWEFKESMKEIDGDRVSIRIRDQRLSLSIFLLENENSKKQWKR